MLQLRIAALLTISISLLHAQTADQDEYNCSHGNLNYLCQNYDICSKYDLISATDRDTICRPFLHPNPGEEDQVDYESSTKTPPVKDSLTSEREQSLTTSPIDDDFSTSRWDDELTTSRDNDDFTHTRDLATFGDTTTDNGITTAFTSDRVTSEYSGTPDSGVTTDTTTDLTGFRFTGSTDTADRVTYSQEYTTANGIVTRERSSEYQGHTREFETLTPGHSRDWFTGTGTSYSYTTEYDNSYTTESDNSFTTGTEAEDSNTVTTESDDSYTTVTTITDDSFTTASTSAFSTEAGTQAPVIEGKPPVITVPPVNITVPPGGSGRFDCTAMAATTPQITITRKDQTTVPDLDNFIEASGNGLSQTTINSITINNVDKPNEGWYTCQAVNKYGYVRHDAYLHVVDLCEGAVCDGDKTCKGNYEAGEGYTCECPTYCDYDELFIANYVCSNYCEEWFNECQMKVDACKNDKFAIEVMNSGRCGRIEYPEIEEEEDSQGLIDLFPGDELVLECHATGFPEPDIIWYRGTEEVGRGNELSLTVTEGDTGEYICEAVNCMRAKDSKRLAVVFVEVVTTPPAPTTSTPYTTPTVEINPAQNSLPDPPRSTCAVFGDPHFLTYDQRAFSYMGTCDNVLAMDCEMARWFVYGRMRPCGRTGGSCLETVTAYVDYEVLELQRGWLVNRNGGKVVPKNHPNKKIVIEGNHNNFTLEFDGAILTLTAVLNRFPSPTDPNQILEDKLVLHWDGYISLQIQTPQNTRTCGMCGDNDGNPDNDMMMRRRGMTEDPVEFGDSWKIDPRGRCTDSEPAKTPEEVCGDRYDEVKAECEQIFDIPKFRNCRDVGQHDTAPWIQSCIYDECEGQMLRDDLPPKCVVAGAYATRCGNDFWDREHQFPTKTEQVKGWEQEADCPDPEERFQPVLDTGCPQPTLEEELAGNF